ncbi:ankyrin repeat protein [Rutstroemia sp. NJR-2017a WRK4]|nr:ankyrin repeat protein [Rutstroemia sp. NJR-2017a WRK4]
MAEAFGVVGIVSSIVQLASFTSKVVVRLNEFHSSINEVPKSIRYITVELGLLETTLQQIKEVIDSGLIEVEKSTILTPTILSCNEQIAEIDSILSRLLPKQTDGRTKKTLKSLDSVFQDGKIQNITKSIQRYIRTLTFYFAASSSSLQPLTDTKLVKIRQWLSAPDPSINYQKALKVRQADTGSWFIQSDIYKIWKTEACSVWLHGIPGCGKTILSSTVLEDVLQYANHDPGTVVAYFYFDFSDQRKQDPELMIRSFVCQLSQQSIKIPLDLDELYKSCENGYRQPSPTKLFEILRQMIEDFPRTYMLVDALDESANRRELMRTVTTMLGWKLPGLHVILTSRKEGDIMRTLERNISYENIVCLQKKEVNQDIQMYSSKWKDDVQPRIESSLIEGAHGMFRWAACQLDILGQCRTRKQLDKALANLPPTLDETYNRILGAIPESDSEYAIRILRWLAFSTRPLLLAEIAEIAALDADRSLAFDRNDVLEDPFDVLSICSSLITITAADDSNDQSLPGPIVLLAHYSVKEYLVSERIRKSRMASYSMEGSVCHRFIARCCLRYLLQFDSPEALNEENFQEFALAKYTAQQWIPHAKANIEDDIETLSLILELMNTDNSAYLTWIQIHDPANPREGTDFNRTLWRIPSPLYYASRAGMVDVARQLLSVKDTDVNSQVGVYGNALYAASEFGNIDTVKVLLDNGANVNAQGGIQGNALNAAILARRMHIIQLLLDKGADVNARIGTHSIAQGVSDASALSLASRVGNLEVVQLLLDKGANVNAQFRANDVSSALARAVWTGNIDFVQLLLKKGARDDLHGGDFDYMLFTACYGGLVSIVKERLDEGANINGQGGPLGNALQVALLRGHKDVVQLLLKNDVDINMPIGGSEVALSLASSMGYTEIVEELLNKGADVNAHGISESNPLCAAAAGGSEQIVKLLLSKGADINAYSDARYTPLIGASIDGYEHIVELLLDEGANINMQRGEYGSALQAASNTGRMEIVQKLLDRGADINLEGGYYTTALIAASDAGHERIVKLLLSNGANINYLGGLYGSVLNTLAFKGHTDILRFAYEQCHAIKNLEDSHKRATIQLAARGGHVSTFKFLTALGLDHRTKDAKGDSLLHYASSGNSLRIVKLVLDDNPISDHCHDGHWTPLHWACRAGNPRVIEHLVKAGFRNELVTTAQPDFQWTPMSIAVFHGIDMKMAGLSTSCRSLLDTKVFFDKYLYGKNPRHATCDSCLFSLASSVWDDGDSA